MIVAETVLSAQAVAVAGIKRTPIGEPERPILVLGGGPDRFITALAVA
jgi:hypothetical protein